jgi:hypothetical protein
VDGDGERRGLYLGPAAGENGVSWEGRLRGILEVEGAFAMIQVMSLSVLDVVDIPKGPGKAEREGKTIIQGRFAPKCSVQGDTLSCCTCQ